jgi:DNA-binding MarR family transcriptional regulator
MTNEEFATTWLHGTNQDMYDLIVENNMTPKEVIQVLAECEREGYLERRTHPNRRIWMLENFIEDFEEVSDED